MTPTTPPDEATPLVKKPHADTYKYKFFHAKPRLLTHDESTAAVPWQTDNEYVINGYRPQLYNIRACLWSAIGCKFMTGRN